jgi:hypothetical protein
MSSRVGIDGEERRGDREKGKGGRYQLEASEDSHSPK